MNHLASLDASLQEMLTKIETSLEEARGCRRGLHRSPLRSASFHLSSGGLFHFIHLSHQAPTTTTTKTTAADHVDIYDSCPKSTKIHTDADAPYNRY